MRGALLKSMTETPARIMIVDDSSVVRGTIARVLEAEGMEVVASASNATAALAALKRPAPHNISPDIMILDVQNGLDTIPKFHAILPNLKIIVSSTLNESNAMASIEALDNGAVELIAKPSSRDSKESQIFMDDVLHKVKQFSRHRAPIVLPNITVAPEPEEIITLRKMPLAFMPKAIAIASSTGGPKALQVVMEGIGKKLAHLPIFITQHMPKDFTASLGLQLAKTAGLEGGEAKQGDIVKAGNIYLAPGDYHMLAEKVGGSTFIRLNQNEQENFCRPAADPMLKSLEKIYGKNLLVVVLTGMGQDGLRGAEVVADAGGVVIAQDKMSSVVWGMPGAVAKAGICHHVIPLPHIPDMLIKLCNG